MNLKPVVESFFQNISSGNIDEAFKVVADDVRWWVPEELPFSGTKNKAEYFAIVSRIQSGFPTGFKLVIKDMIIQGDKAAVEVESEGTHVNGKRYHNKYHFLIQVTDGKFQSVKEYMNTLHLFRLIS
jgi:uncharacterized protein